jgi:hypothetical protein
LSDLVGVWHKGKKRKPKGLAAMDGFKGIIDFDKHYSEFDGGVDALGSLLKRHPLVGIDLGTKTHASMVVLNGSLAANENETICKGKWIEKLFAKNRTKQRYYRSIANRILSQSHAIAPEKTGAYIGDWKTYLCIIHERT